LLFVAMNFKKLQLLAGLLLLTGTTLWGQNNFGIGVANPTEKLDVAGAIKLGNTAATNLGSIRYTGTDFEGYVNKGSGPQWYSLTQGGGASYTAGTGLTLTGTQFSANAMGGASAGSPGTAGIVPQPLAGQQNSFLRGDGTWAAAPTPTTGNLTLANPALGSVTGGTNAVIGAGTSISINNTAALWNANQLQGRAVVNTVPTNGQVLKWNNTLSQWEPSNDLGTTYTGTLPVSIAGTVIDVNTMTGATAGVGGTRGVVPAPAAGQQNNFLRGDGTWAAAPTAAAMVGATGAANGTAGIVPQPLAGQQNNFLRGDGTWAAAPTAAAMVGATGAANGTAGIVPQPLAGQQNSFLRGDGTWAAAPTPTSGNLTNAGVAATLTITGGAGAVLGAGTSITVNNTNALWNANQFQGTPVAATVPTLGQVLIYNGASWTPSAIPTPFDLTAGSGVAFTVGTTYNGTVARTITAPQMTGATAGAAGTAGIVPQPLAGQQNNFLRGDGTWAAAPTAAAMVGATAGANGTAGIVPQPLAGQQNSFLRGDGTWVASTVTAQNGLNTTASGTGAVELGGTLLRPTNVAQAGFNLTFTGAGNVGIGQAAPTHRTHVTNPLDIGAAVRAVFAEHLNTAAGSTAIEGVTSSNIAVGNTASGVLGRTLGGGSGVRGEGVVIGVNGIATRTVAAGGSVGVSGTGASYGLQANGTDATTGIGTFALGNNLTALSVSLTTGGGVVAEGTLNGVVGVGSANGGFGVYGWGVNTTNSFGVVGQANNTALLGPANGAGVLGLGSFRGAFFQGSRVADGIGVVGLGNNLTAFPVSATGAGVIGRGNTAGIRGYGAFTTAGGGSVGVSGEGATYGVQAVGTDALTGIGVLGFGNNASAILGTFPTTGAGVVGSGSSGTWGVALSDAGFGAFGINGQPITTSIPIGVYGESTNGIGVSGEGGIAGIFSFGDQVGFGTKAFFIDHPQHPSTKFLRHFSIESDEVLNVYRGTAIMDANGEAIVTLKNYVVANNIDFTYQLTPIGMQANAYIKSELSGDRFVIAGGAPGQKISWVVYAERNDPYLMQNPEKRQVELDKPAALQGKYLTPHLYGRTKADRIYAPDMNKVSLKPLGGETRVEELQLVRPVGQQMEQVKPIGR
jgi:hypothetical protein